MSRLTGYIYEDLCLDEWDLNVSEAIVTDTRIAIEWKEDGQHFFLQAKSTDGVIYDGEMRDVPEARTAVQITRYSARDGGELLICKWHNKLTGYEGDCIFELDLE